MVELRLPKLYPRQQEAIFSPKRFSLIEAGTKTGKTISAAIWLVNNAWNKGKSNWWWVAPVYPQALIGFKRCVSLLPQELVTVNWSALQITLPNGSTIQARSGEKPDNLYGEAIDGCVIDEASRLKELSWHAVRSTLTQTRGSARIIGNPKGKSNWFYKLCQQAKDPLQAEQFAYFHLRTIDNPYIQADEVEQARKVLPKHVFDELYLGIAQDDIAGVFRNIRACIRPTFQEPLQLENYYIGADLAKVRDYTVISVLNSQRELVAFERLHNVSWVRQREILHEYAKKYNHAKVLLDSTGIGDPIYEELRREGLDCEGYHFTNESKKKLIEGLAVAIENKQIFYPEIQELLSELELFEYQVTPSGNITYSAPEGYHDDCVISLALANWCMGTLRRVTMKDINETQAVSMLPSERATPREQREQEVEDLPSGLPDFTRGF